MDSSSRGQGNFTPSGPDQQLPGSLFRGHSPLSNSSQGGGSLRDANSTKEENTAVDPLLDGEQQHNAGPDNVGEDNWPTSYQQPKEKARESYHNSSTGGKGSGEEAVSFLSRPFERLDQLGLLTQFEQDAKETAEFEKELLLRILELMVEFRVWAESRPTHENEVHSAKLIRDLDAIEERELNQENTRLSLVRFLATIRQALNALTQA